MRCSWPRFRAAPPPDQEALERLRDHPDLAALRLHLLLLRDQCLAALLADPCHRWADKARTYMDLYEWLAPKLDIEKGEE